MTEERDMRDETTADATETLPPVDAQSTPHPPADDLELPYTMGEWGDLPLWKCRFCLYATVDGESALYTHLQRHVTSGERPSGSGLIDAQGNPL